MLRTLAGVTLFALVVFSIWWVQAPPRGSEAYRESAETAIEKLRSRTETARLWVDQLERDRVLRTAVEVSLEEAETGAISALGQFEGYDPPRRLEPLRTDIAQVGDEVTTVLSDLRIAARQGRWAELPRLAEPLEELSSRLDQLSRRAEP